MVDNEKYNILTSKRIAYILTFVAGMIGVYSFKISSGIFCNGLTGDLLYIGINIINKNILKAMIYLLVVLFFSVGVIVGHCIKCNGKCNKKSFHDRHIILIVEMFILIVSYFINNELAVLYLLAMVLGLQIEVYLQIGEDSFSSVNYVGNTRAAAVCLAKFIVKKEKKYLYSALKYYYAFIFFVIGGIVENIIYNKYYKISSLVCVGFLFLINIYIYIKKHNYIYKPIR